MLKSTTKHRRSRNRLFISILTVALLFSYSLNKKDNIYHAITGTAYQQTYTWGSITYGAISQTALSASSQLFIFDIQCIGVYDGTINVNFSSTLSGISIEPFNCALTSIGTQSFQVRLTNANSAYVLIYSVSTTALNIQSITHNLTKLTDGVPYLVERINSKMNDVKQEIIDVYNRIGDVAGYVDGIEGYLSTMSTTLNSWTTLLNTLSTTTTNILTDTNSLVTYTNAINTYLTTLHNDNTSIYNRLGDILNNMSTSNNDTNLINDIESNLNIINNIEGGFLNDLDLEIITGKNGYEYIRDVIVDHQTHTSAKNTLNVYQNEMIGPWGSGQHIFSYLHQYLMIIIAFILIGVIIG